MNATTPSSPGGLPTRSEIESWDTSDLDNAATRWRVLAAGSEELFAQHRHNITAAGGTAWAGDARDAAIDRVTADMGVVRNQGDIQREAAQAVVDGRIASAAGAVDFPNGKPFALVFHGGSGSRPEEIAEAVRYGVVKMNIDTDTQYAFTRAIADHVFSNYDAVLKVDGEVGEKKLYDPRSWGREAESAMAARVVEACKQLGSAGKALK